MRRRIWSMAWQRNLLMKYYYKKYHCHICNIILQVIQWNVTWNIIHIYLIHGRRIWSVAICLWVLKMTKEKRLYLCNMFMSFYHVCQKILLVRCVHEENFSHQYFVQLCHELHLFIHILSNILHKYNLLVHKYILIIKPVHFWSNHDMNVHNIIIVSVAFEPFDDKNASGVKSCSLMTLCYIWFPDIRISP